MTLDETINTLEAIIQTGEYEGQPHDQPCLELAIEVLKAWKEFRGTGSLMDKMLLPGETEES